MLRKALSIGYILVGVILGFIFFGDINFPVGLEPYFEMDFYRQFGHIVLAVELIIAGIYLFINHNKTNFTMGLFGFSATLDPIFNYLGFFSSNVPLYGSIIFFGFAIVSFWIAFSDAFDTGKISMFNLITSFILGLIIEFFFNYL